MSTSTPSRGTALALTLAAASWGIGTVVSKRATAEIPPLTLLFIQLAASLIVLGLYMYARRLAFRDPSSSPVLGRLGLLNPGLAYALSLLGLGPTQWLGVAITFVAIYLILRRTGALRLDLADQPIRTEP